MFTIVANLNFVVLAVLEALAQTYRFHFCILLRTTKLDYLGWKLPMVFIKAGVLRSYVQGDSVVLFNQPLYLTNVEIKTIIFLLQCLNTMREVMIEHDERGDDCLFHIDRATFGDVCSWSWWISSGCFRLL